MPAIDEVVAARRAPQASRSTARPNVIATLILILSMLVGLRARGATQNTGGLLLGGLVDFVFSQSPKIAKQWERAVVLRLGRYTGRRGPGVFWVARFIETVSSYMDQRVVAPSFAAEE